MYLAQFNLGKIKYPLDDRRMSQFVDNVKRVNKLAEQSLGFVWRLKDNTDTAMYMRVYDDLTILPNLTVWKDTEALRWFVFKTVHYQFYKNREKWFDPLLVSNVMWWCQEHLKPTLLEGVKRRDYFINNGPTEHAFVDYNSEHAYINTNKAV